MLHLPGNYAVPTAFPREGNSVAFSLNWRTRMMMKRTSAVGAVGILAITITSITLVYGAQSKTAVQGEELIKLHDELIQAFVKREKTTTHRIEAEDFVLTDHV